MPPAARLAAPAAVLLALLHLAATATAANFTCSAPRGTTCHSAIGYRVPNATTYGALLARFNTTTLAGLLGANNLPPDTRPSSPVAAKQTVRIPFPCLCAGNGVGQSDHAPVYTVKPQDGLDAIARNSFDAVVTYQEIAAANNITDVNLIDVGQKLWIPLPCSCDPVGGADVLHLAHVVDAGESTSGIAATYGVTEDTLLTLNNIADPKTLQKDQVLDVPLPVCSSSISNTSADHDLRLSNGTYALTAQDCIQCRCSSNTFQLNCTALQGKKGCPAAPPCSEGLKLGDTSGAGCDSKMCAYSGYSNSSTLSIHTTLLKNQTAPACEICSSSISNTSADHDLRLSNGTYALTAQDCIQCRCSSNTFQLNCTALQGKKGCPAAPPCSEGLKLGDTSGAGCDSKMCAYSGYSNSSTLSIHTTLLKNQTAPACEKGGSSRSVFAGSMWRISAISFHMVLILVCFL